MDRIEIVDPGANGEAGFSIESKKWPAVEERVIMLSTAGTEYTLSKPSLCPYYGDHLKLPETAIPPSIGRRDYRFGRIASGARKISAPFT